MMTPFEAIPLVGQVPRATYSLGRGITRLFGRSAATRVGVWSMQPVVRGVALEQAYGGNLPPYFPVIDRFVDGVATSIKSIDLSANSYQSMSALTATMTRYINKLSTFAGAARMGATVRGPEITARTLEVIVPSGSATAAQQAVINAAVQYGQTVGVAVKIIEH